MSSLKSLENKSLIERTKHLVHEERKITLQLIEHLREIERRMLFADLGYGSLYEFAMEHLGLSEGAAYRRIAAMRLVRDLPEAKAKLETGELSLSNAARLNRTFRVVKQERKSDNQQPLALERKREILEKVSGLSQRECESKLFELLPHTVNLERREIERRIGQDSTELKLVITDSLVKKLTRLKELLSHKFPTGSSLELLEHLADQELKRLEKKTGFVENAPQNDSQPGQTSNPAFVAMQTEKLRSDTLKKGQASERASHAANVRGVWNRAQGRCEYPGCDSRYQLQIDHKLPRALGGANEVSNLRLLCRMHNLQQAKLKLGTGKMSLHVPWLK